MEPTGSGRLRGFRAPQAGEVRSGDPSSGGATGRGLSAPLGPREASAPEAPVTPPNRGAGWRWAAASAAGLVVAVVLIAALAFRLGSTAAAPYARSSDSPTPTPAATPSQLAVPDLYRRVIGSVVLVTTSEGSLGSGVVVTDTGTVLTANHVVSGGGRVSIVFADGTKADARVVSAAPETDTAMLQPDDLPEVVIPAVLGGGVAVGADVVAIGNPLGLRASASTGVVSGLNRTNTTKDGTLTGLIQFDAAVNPGSSGGPLLNAQGLVVGIVVSIADPGEDEAFAGIGFAVPIGVALGGGDGDGPGGPPL